MPEETNITQSAIDRVEARLRESQKDLELHLRELLTHERNERYAQQTSNETALKLQASEYNRRLMELNHAHKTAEEVASRTVTREVFEQYKENQAKQQATADGELQAFKDAVNKFITQETVKSMEFAGQSARNWAVGMSVGMLILSIISTIAMHYMFPAAVAVAPK